MIARLVEALEQFPRSSRRRICIIYGVALIIGTHIPRFRLGGSNLVVPPDRILHVLAFGGLAGLLTLAHFINRTQPIFNRRNIYGSAVIALLWGGITELTQQFLVPGRWANLWDVGCNLTGIGIAVGVGLTLRTVQQRHQNVSKQP